MTLQFLQKDKITPGNVFQHHNWTVILLSPTITYAFNHIDHCCEIKLSCDVLIANYNKMVQYELQTGLSCKWNYFK